ncbi:MAG TPA: hypothetical protein PKX07_07420 [Aggregatilineales bacterium]|jgi:hypothetical protein|nr:hypothetical protein [Aggregatilineales bacterium]
MRELRRYLLIGLGFAIGVGLLAHFGGPLLVGWLGEVRGQASNMGVVVTLVIEPLVWAFSNPLPAAGLALVAWPLLLALLIGLFAIILIAYSTDAIRAVLGQL